MVLPFRRPSFTYVVLVFFLVIVFVSSTIFAQDFIIEGKVTSSPHMVHPLVNIIATDNLSGDTLATTQTDEAGNYILVYSTVDVKDLSAWETAMQILPNPFPSQAKLKMYVDADAYYMLSVHCAIGKLLLNKPLWITEGQQIAEVYFQGPTGVYLIGLAGQNKKSWVRALHISREYHNKEYFDCRRTRTNDRRRKHKLGYNFRLCLNK